MRFRETSGLANHAKENRRGGKSKFRYTSPEPAKYQKYLDYIHNAKSPTIAQFDEDWEPIGPTVRAEMLAGSLISYADGRVIVNNW